MLQLKESKHSLTSVMIPLKIDEAEQERIFNKFQNDETSEIFKSLSHLKKDEIFQILFAPIWLNVKWHYNCYYYYAEYYFEAWTTSSADPNGPRIPVDQIEIFWRHNSTKGHEVKNGVDMVAKSDRTYNFGCDTDMCISGRATHYGISWGINNPETCVPV